MHRADLAVAEEAAERHVAEVPAEGVGVVVRGAVEMLAAAEAREEQRAGGPRRGSALSSASRSAADVSASRRWNCTTMPSRASVRPRARRSCRRCRAGCGSGSRPGRYSWRSSRITTPRKSEWRKRPRSSRARALVQLLQAPRARGRPSSSLEDVALAARHEHRLADRPAALGDDGVDRDVAAERDADHAAAVDRVAEVERVAARRRGRRSRARR